MFVSTVTDQSRKFVYGCVETYRYSFNGKEKDPEVVASSGNTQDYGMRIYNPSLGRFLSVDRCTSNFPHFSPYLFAGNTPISGRDANGDSLYIVIYTRGNSRGDDNSMFLASALTRAYDIKNSGHYDEKRDFVAVIGVTDISDVVDKVNTVVKQLSPKYGKTSEFSTFSHAGFDGPCGSEESKKFNLGHGTGASDDKYQMSMKGWSTIDFNWAEGSRANFFGCGTGDIETTGEGTSFSTQISALPNFKNVTVFGITSVSFPSTSLKRRSLTLDMKNGEFHLGNQSKGKDKVYMVGGDMHDKSAIFGIGKTYPMRQSKNGKGEVKKD